MQSFFWIAIGIFALFSIGSSVFFFLFVKRTPNIMKKMSKTVISMKKDIITEHEDDLKYIADKEADIAKDSITKKARAVKDGLKDEDIYCKHCGASIDADSKFCKRCGKEQ